MSEDEHRVLKRRNARAPTRPADGPGELASASTAAHAEACSRDGQGGARHDRISGGLWVRSSEFAVTRSGLSRSERARRAAEVLAANGLEGYADHPAHQLSSGQKQLLALCGMLAVDPDVLVCDESTTLLDLRNTRRFAEILAGLRLQVLLVTHDLDLLAGFDRVIGQNLCLARRGRAELSHRSTTPRQLLDLLRRGDCRLVRGDADLLDVILKQLDRLQHDTRRENAFQELWNNSSGPVPAPAGPSPSRSPG